MIFYRSRSSNSSISSNSRLNALDPNKYLKSNRLSIEFLRFWRLIFCLSLEKQTNLLRWFVRLKFYFSFSMMPKICCRRLLEYMTWPAGKIWVLSIRYIMTPERTFPAMVYSQTCSIYSFWTCFRTAKVSYSSCDFMKANTREVRMMFYHIEQPVIIWMCSWLVTKMNVLV